MFKKFSTLVLFVVILSWSCDLRGLLNSSHYKRDSNTPIILFDDIDKISISTDHTNIQDAIVEGDLLMLDVVYGGGCEKHEFKLYGWKGITKSNPPQAEIFLSHNANNDVCDALIYNKLTFDLTPLKLHYRKNYHQGGPLVLRIYAAGYSEPFLPLPLYKF